jgi:hypothetical protein
MNRITFQYQWIVIASATLILRTCAILDAQESSYKNTSAKETVMSTRSESQGKIIWKSKAEDLETYSQVYFFFSPGGGLRDLDFHLITGEGWKTMKAPSLNVVARLQVSPKTSIAEIHDVISLIHNMGGYQTIEISVNHEKDRDQPR